MKRIFAILLSLCLFFPTLACTIRPFATVPAPLHMDSMLAEAQKPPESGAQGLAAQYGIPETYTFSGKGSSWPYLSVTADALVVIPAVDRIPVVRVSAAEFSQAQVDVLWRELVGDTEMWKIADAYGASRVALVYERINDDREVASQWLLLPHEALEWLEEVLANYANATQNDESVRSYGQLEEALGDGCPMRQEDNRAKLPTYQALYAYDRDYPHGMYIRVENDSVYEDAKQANYFRPSRDASFYYGRNSEQHWGGFMGFSGSGLYLLQSVDAQTELGSVALAKVGISPAEAFGMAQAFLDAACNGMAIESAHFSASVGTYTFMCAREVGGVLVSHTAQRSFRGTRENFNASWGYEHLQLELTRDGICHVEWFAPLTVHETVIADAKLLPFSEIQAIFEQMVFVKYASSYTEGIRIDRVELSLQRIADQGSYESGLLVPVWNFYEKDRSVFYTNGNHSILCINAIDGTIINPQEG
ncbi:MAG: DUF6034 family protein [Clostridiales bacterium]|nr:DUF6034 family protein [Clostridiales bacterium]